MNPPVWPHPESFAFDLDGTLIDSSAGISSALGAAFSTVGREMAERELMKAIGPPIRIIARRLDPQLTEDEAITIEKAYRTLYDEDAWRETSLFEGVAATLRSLHESGHRLFVVTNKPKLPAMRILNHFGLQELFTEVVTRDLTTPPFNNKAEMLGHLVLHHQVKPESAVMVGDTAEDGEAADANGIPFVFMTYGYGETKTACRRLDRFADLLQPDITVKETAL